MPNQLAQSKRRQSLAEHEAVLAALAEIARREDTTVMALLRRAARQVVCDRVGKKAADAPHDSRSRLREALRRKVWEKAPVMPERFTSAAQVARFKRQQREFDQALLDMNLETPQTVQRRNSVARSRRSIRLLDFDQAHGA